MPWIGSFGLSRWTKYKLELNHVIRVAVNKHVFGETKFTYLRVTSTCSQKNSAGQNKTRQNRRKGIKLPLETIAFYSDSFVARKINAQRKVAENWAPHCRVVLGEYQDKVLTYLCAAKSVQKPPAKVAWLINDFYMTWWLIRTLEIDKSYWDRTAGILLLQLNQFRKANCLWKRVLTDIIWEKSTLPKCFSC